MLEGKLRDLLADLDVNVIHKNSRDWLVAPCPFAEHLHEFGTDRNPSFFVAIDGERNSGFRCFTCGQKGSLSRLVNRLSFYREEDYSQLLAQVAEGEVPDQFQDWDETREQRQSEVVAMDPLDAELYMRLHAKAWEEKPSRKFLKKRNVSSEASELLNLRYDSASQRVLFPVYDHEHNLFGFTGRSILDVEWSKQVPKVRDYGGLKKEQLLLGEQLFQEDKPWLVVEGLFALARMVTIGARQFCNPVATMGSYLSDNHRDALVAYGVPVFMLYDDDAAGDKGLYGAEDDPRDLGAVAKLEPFTPVKVCLYPETVDDPDDLKLKHVRKMVCGDWNE